MNCRQKASAMSLLEVRVRSPKVIGVLAGALVFFPDSLRRRDQNLVEGSLGPARMTVRSHASRREELNAASMRQFRTPNFRVSRVGVANLVSLGDEGFGLPRQAGDKVARAASRDVEIRSLREDRTQDPLALGA